MGWSLVNNLQPIMIMARARAKDALASFKTQSAPVYNTHINVNIYVCEDIYIHICVSIYTYS